jgi:hypothetical protein
MAVTVSVRTNIDKNVLAIGKITSAIKDKATIRAINHAAKKVRTETDRRITKVYNIKKKDIKSHMKVDFAHKGQAVLAATLTMSGTPIPLINFAAKAKNPWNVPGRPHKKKGGGVTVKIKKTGGKKLIPSAFITTTKSGRESVFIRTNVPGAPQVKGGSQPYDPPIVTLRSVSLPSMFASKAISDALQLVALRQFNKEYERQVRLLSGTR